jgi:hypothetical protein
MSDTDPDCKMYHVNLQYYKPKDTWFRCDECLKSEIK